MSEKADPFDPERYRQAAQYGADVGAKREFKRISVRKPAKTEWVRASDDPAHQLDVMVFKPGDEMNAERDEIYLVDPSMVEHVADDGFMARVFLTVNRFGDPFLWFVRLPEPDGRINPWSETALAAVADAQAGWIKVKANMRMGGYEINRPGPGVNIPDPTWPDSSMGELLRLGFQGRVIDNAEHVILKHLRGDA